MDAVGPCWGKEFGPWGHLDPKIISLDDPKSYLRVKGDDPAPAIEPRPPHGDCIESLLSSDLCCLRVTLLLPGVLAGVPKEPIGDSRLAVRR